MKVKSLTGKILNSLDGRFPSHGSHGNNHLRTYEHSSLSSTLSATKNTMWTRQTWLPLHGTTSRKSSGLRGYCEVHVILWKRKWRLKILSDSPKSSANEQMYTLNPKTLKSRWCLWSWFCGVRGLASGWCYRLLQLYLGLEGYAVGGLTQTLTPLSISHLLYEVFLDRKEG